MVLKKKRGSPSRMQGRQSSRRLEKNHTGNTQTVCRSQGQHRRRDKATQGSNKQEVGTYAVNLSSASLRKPSVISALLTKISKSDSFW